MLPDWIIALDSIGKFGSAVRQNGLARKFAKIIRQEMALCSPENDKKIDNLSKQAFLLIKHSTLANTNDPQCDLFKIELFELLVEDETSHEPVLESAVACLITTSHCKQRLTCLDEYAEIEVMWPENQTKFYCKVDDKGIGSLAVGPVNNGLELKRYFPDINLIKPPSVSESTSHFCCCSCSLVFAKLRRSRVMACLSSLVWSFRKQKQEIIAIEFFLSLCVYIANFSVLPWLQLLQNEKFQVL